MYESCPLYVGPYTAGDPESYLPEWDLSGGISNMSGLDAYVESMTKIHTTAAEKPGICAVNGLKKIMLSKDLSKLAYSMLDESYRWMR